MNAQERNRVAGLHAGGVSIRQIARTMEVARNTVRSVLRRIEAQRNEPGEHPQLKRPPRRASCLDEHEQTVLRLLNKYPDITAMRVFEELRADGFAGGYTIVKDRVREQRPRPPREPVERFETGPGQQAQMDYSPFTIDFIEEGTRQVHLFSYVLGFSRRRYHHWVEAQDFPTTVREHIKAFEYFDGLAATCLYDNMKVVVLRHEDEQPIYNPRFLGFCTHYGYRPWACRRYRAKTKGKVERPFQFVASSLLNGRKFYSLKHLNEQTQWWLDHVADVRPNRTTGRPPLELFREEQVALLRLPTHPYDTAEIAYRVVDAEGCVAYMANQYMVPWQYIGFLLPVKITETTLTVFTPQIAPIAEHALFPRSITGQKRRRKAFEPGENRREQFAMLVQRYEQLGPVGKRFLDAVVAKRRYGRHEAFRIITLLGTYRREDVIAALQRAVRYHAYSLHSVERILSIQATPRPPIEALGQRESERIREWLNQERVQPRATDEYLTLYSEPDQDPKP